MPVIIDDFEDGDIVVSGANWSGWSGDTGSFSATSSSPIAGSFSGALTAADASRSVSATRSSETAETFAATVRIESDTGGAFDQTEIEFRGAGSLLGQLVWNDSGELRWSGSSTQTLLSSWSAGTAYEVAFGFDPSADEVLIEVNGTVFGPYGTFDSYSGINEVTFTTSTTSSAATRTALIDDVRTDDAGTSSLAVDATRAAEVDLSWTAADNADEYALYRAESAGVTTSDTLVTTTSSTAYTDAGLENGERYYYLIEARDTDGVYAATLSNEADGTTTLPTPTIDSSTAASTSAIDISYSLADNSSDGDVAIIADGSVVETRSLADPTSTTVTGLAEATSPGIVVRRRTDHVTADSGTDGQYTKPAAPALGDVLAIDGDDITVGVTDNSANEDGYRALDSTDGGSNYVVAGSTGASATQVTATNLSRPDTHTLTVEAFVGNGLDEATNRASGVVERYLSPSRASTNGATWLVEIEHSSGRVVRFQPSDASFTPRLNDLPQFEATVEFDERWLSSAFDDAPMCVWKNGRRLPIDTLVDRPTSPGETTLRGRGGSQLLRQADTTVTQNPVYETGESLVEITTDYIANFDDPTAETTTNTLIQKATTSAELQNIIAGTLPDDTPLRFPPSAGLITPAQTCFLGLNDGGDAQPQGSFSEVSDGSLTDSNWEDADAMRVGPGQSLYFDFELEHRIPGSDMAVALRSERGGSVDLTMSVDGITILDATLSGSSPIEWFTLPSTEQSYPTLSEPDNPVRVRIDNNDSSNNITVDALALVDTRYHTVSNFPNQIITDVSEPGYLYLPGPAKFPDEVSFVTDDATPPVSLSGARLVVEHPSGFAPKRLELSPDQGQSYPLSATDVETLEGDFASLAAQVRTRVTIGADGVGQSETPTDGYASPEVTTFELYADLDDTALFVAENFQGSVRDVLIDGADYADAAWEVQWDDENQTQSVEWTEAGQRSDVADIPISDFDFSRTTEQRRDRIRVVGRSIPVVDESFSADHGTAVQLANEPILTDSETVEGASTQYVQGQDYEVDWEAGTITTFSSGNIDDGDSLVISYRWQPLGVADRAGASAPYTVRKIALPALSTDRECEIAARRIRDATDEPLEEAEVTLTPDAIGLEAIDELQFTGLPTDRTLEVNEITDQAGSQVVSLGSRESVSGVVDDIRRKLSSTAENS